MTGPWEQVWNVTSTMLQMFVFIKKVKNLKRKAFMYLAWIAEASDIVNFILYEK